MEMNEVFEEIKVGEDEEVDEILFKIHDLLRQLFGNREISEIIVKSKNRWGLKYTTKITF